MSKHVARTGLKLSARIERESYKEDFKVSTSYNWLKVLQLVRNHRRLKGLKLSVHFTAVSKGVRRINKSFIDNCWASRIILRIAGC